MSGQVSEADVPATEQAQKSRAVAAELPVGVGEHVAREDEEAAGADEFAGAAGDDLGPGFAALVGFVLFVVFVLEAGLGGAFPEDDVEGFFDVVGVELLVEVDDLLVVLFGGGRGFGVFVLVGGVGGGDFFVLVDFVDEQGVVVVERVVV